VENSSERLVLRDRTLWISAICLSGAGILAAQWILRRDGADALLAAAVAVFFGLAFLRASDVTFDRSARRARIRRFDVLRFTRRELAFDEITEVRIEIDRTHDPDAFSYRLSLSTASAAIPLSAAFEPGFDRHATMRDEIQKAVNGDRPWPAQEDPVRALVKQGRIIDAVALLRTRDGLSLSEAHTRVAELRASLQPGQD
jgi:hypothetical protein